MSTNERRITIFIANWLVLLFVLILPYAADAGVPPVKADSSAHLKKADLLCQQIQEKIKNKQEIRKVVKASIQMGYSACGVIKCSINGGGDLKQVIGGAVEAGTTKDVVSKCALDACVAAKDAAAGSGAHLANAKEGPLCGEIRDKMKNNGDGREIVKTSIQMGHDTCGVIRCAVKAGCEVSQAIAGAIDAGSTKDAATRCISEGCARDVAVILMEQLKQCNVEEAGLGYSPPEEEPGAITPDGRRRPFISPSGF